MLGCGNLNILLRFVKKIYSLPVVVYSLKKKENWKNDVSFYKKIIFGIIIMYYTIGKHFKKTILYKMFSYSYILFKNDFMTISKIHSCLYF